MNKEKYIIDNYKDMTNNQLASELNIQLWDVWDILKKNKLTRRELYNVDYNSHDEKFVCMIGFKKYIVSSNGIVIRAKDSILIKEAKSTDGYSSIKMVNDEGKRKTMRLQRVIALCFLDPIRDINISDQVVNHKDGIISNNQYTNLEWTTHSDNLKHSYDILNRPKIHRKLRENEVRIICEYLEEGKSPEYIHSHTDFYTSIGNIVAIKKRKNWSKLTQDYNF